MQLQSHRMEKTEKDGAIPFASSYFFRRILVFEEATRKGSHAKKKKREREKKLERIVGCEYPKNV